MTGAAPGELNAILGAIREVSASLDRRAARLAAATCMVWGVAVATVLAFYHLVQANPAPYHAAFGPLVSWVWIGPIAVAYVASVALGAARGRVTAKPLSPRERWAALLMALVPSVVVAALVLTRQYERIPGATVLWLALSGYLWLPQACPRSVALADRALKAAALVGGLALLAWPVEWAYLAGAAFYAVGLVGVGTVQYFASR